MKFTITLVILLLLALWLLPKRKQMYETIAKNTQDQCPKGFTEATNNLCLKA